MTACKICSSKPCYYLKIIIKLHNLHLHSSLIPHRCCACWLCWAGGRGLVWRCYVWRWVHGFWLRKSIRRGSSRWYLGNYIKKNYSSMILPIEIWIWCSFICENSIYRLVLSCFLTWWVSDKLSEMYEKVWKSMKILERMFMYWKLHVLKLKRRNIILFIFIISRMRK